MQAKNDYSSFMRKAGESEEAQKNATTRLHFRQWQRLSQLQFVSRQWYLFLVQLRGWRRLYARIKYRLLIHHLWFYTEGDVRCGCHAKNHNVIARVSESMRELLYNFKNLTSYTLFVIHEKHNNESSRKGNIVFLNFMQDSWVQLHNYISVNSLSRA